MKKLLIGALMALAATSAMAVTAPVTGKAGSGEATVIQPIKVIGEVYVPTDLTLVVTPAETAAVAGDDLVFDLGRMPLGGRPVSRIGKVEAYLIKGTPAGSTGTPAATVQKYKFDNAPTFKLVDLSNGSQHHGATDTAVNGLVATPINLPIDYSLSANQTAGGLDLYTATVGVTGHPEATGVKEGSFVQRELGVKVEVTAQKQGI